LTAEFNNWFELNKKVVAPPVAPITK
jgi:hypothetical protein